MKIPGTQLMKTSLLMLQQGLAQTALGSGRLAMLSVWMLLISAHVSAERRIMQILPQQSPEQGTTLAVVFNGPATLPQAYQLQHPSRLVLDFAGVQPLHSKRRYS